MPSNRRPSQLGSHFHWVGFYGSEDDNRIPTTPPGFDKLATGPEAEHYAEFLRKQKTEIAQGEGRYRFLPPQLAARPNLDFNSEVTCLNMKRMLRAFAESPLAPRLIPAIQFGEVVLDDIPDDLMARAKRKYEDVEKQTLQVMKAAIQRRLARHRQLVGEPMGRVRESDIGRSSPGLEEIVSNDVKAIAPWRFLFEEILKRPFRPFSTSRHEDFTLNLSADSFLHHLWSDSYLDAKTGRIAFDRYPLPAPPSFNETYSGNIGFQCSFHSKVPFQHERKEDTDLFAVIPP